MRRQCELLSVARSSVDYRPVPESEEDLRIKRILDEIYLIDPCLGSRRLVTVLDRDHDIALALIPAGAIRAQSRRAAGYHEPQPVGFPASVGVSVPARRGGRPRSQSLAAGRTPARASCHWS